MVAGVAEALTPGTGPARALGGLDGARPHGDGASTICECERDEGNVFTSLIKT